ncbi:MAG: efflux RND transporter permease subunit, partial [Planctomycetota bacterium]|nr:efflux RND transporter permease subunit [Planctomycetota bacterium]
MLTLAVSLWGVYCLQRTPVDAIPDLSENQVIVFTDWMGRSPQEVEDQITYPLSVNLQGLAGVKAVRSTSEFNYSMINVIFDDGVEFYFARERVLERLATSATFLPPGVVPYMAPDATALGQIFWYTVEGALDPGALRTLQDWYVRYQLNAVPGVAGVSSVGGFVQEYQIDVDPGRLRAYGVTLGEVFSAVARANSSVGGNVLQKNRAEFLIRGEGWIQSKGDIESIVVAERDGVPIFVRHLGAVQLGPEPRRSMLEKDGGEAVGGVVLMRYGENPLAVTERIKARIETLQAGLPEGVRIVPFYDRTPLIQDAIGTLTKTLIEEMLVASLMVFLILYHLRSSFVICATLPLAVLISFIFMYYLDVPSNIMSLAGIAISIGVLLDAGIVMTENAYARLHEHFGDQPVTGDTRPIVLQACKVVGRPLFFSVVIMLVSFLPVFALTGMEGKMFHPLALTKSFALIGVSLLAVTLVPALIPTFVRGRLRGERESWLLRSVIDVYRPVLLFLLERPKLVALNFAILIGIGLNLWPKLGREFMPPLNEGSIMDMPVTVPSASITEAAEDLTNRDALLRTL